MKRKYVQPVLAGLLAILLTGPVYATVPVAHAQSLQYWSDPVNLSNAGSSTDPRIVIDSDGVIHVVWVDAIDGYKYTESADGKVWTPPVKANFPFSIKDDSRPDFFSNAKGLIFVVWRDKKNALHVAQTQSRGFSNSSSWGATSVIASSTVVAYDAVVDSQGVLRLSYVTTGDPSSPAGVFYSQVSPGGSSKTVSIYSSGYFRSLDHTSAHVRIATSKNADTASIYIAWDDRPQKRIFLVKSSDGGKSWGEASEITGPEAVTGTSMPFNVDIGAMNDKVLVTWQSGQPGGQCTSYSEWSLDGGQQFGQRMKVSDPSSVCAQPSQFVRQDESLSIASFDVLDEISLIVWNGSEWSKPQPQDEIAAFTNPVTLDSVIFGCQHVSVRDTTLYVVGCDKGNGGDIWFSSRSLGTLDDWFPPSSAWSTPGEVTSTDQKISALSSVATGENTIHAFWIQTPLLEGNQGMAMIEGAQWNGANWSSPMPIVSQPGASPMQLSVKADSQGRLLLAWVDGKTGGIFFSWANAARASNPGEWQSPKQIPLTSDANSSPDLLVDASGKIILVYAIPINENRGIYFVESDDGGTNWTQPIQVFDAASAGWEIVDQPHITVTGDGRLHVLFSRYSFYAEQRQSLGLYYAQSADGGVTWSKPEAVSEDPIAWSQIIGYGRYIVHRLWQQNRPSMLVTFHQISHDGGLTWSRAAAVPGIAAASGLTTLSIDQAGNLDLLQLDSKDSPVISDQRWDGSGWLSEAPKELYIKDRGVPTSITAGTTSSGTLLVSVSVDYPFLTSETKNDILSVGKSLASPKVIQTSYPAIIPAAKKTAMMTEGTPGILQPSTKAPPPAGLNDSPSFFSGKKNLVGFLLLGGILVLIVLVFRPIPTKRNTEKKTPR